MSSEMFIIITFIIPCLYLRAAKKEDDGMAEWLTRRTCNPKIASCMGSKQSQAQANVSLSKKLYTNCSVLVGSKNCIESVYKLIALYTVEQKFCINQIRKI